MSPRRAYAFCVIMCLVGAALIVAAGGQAWVHLTLDRGAGAPVGAQSLVGRDLAGPITGLGLVGLAGVAALVATRGWFRRFIGLLLDVAGIWAIVASVVGRGASHVADVVARTAPDSTVMATRATAWPWLAVAGGALLAAGGAIAAVTGGRWASMSRRYDAPQQAAAAPNDPWAALDRGDDPTL